LPKLSYSYQSLEPFISERQLKIHHQKHHQGYVNGANAILEKLEQSRKKPTKPNVDIGIDKKDIHWQ